MADVIDGSIAVEVGKPEVVDLDLAKSGDDESVTKGLKRKLEETDEPKLNGDKATDHQTEEKNGHADTTEEKTEKNGHSKNGNSVAEEIVKDSPVKKAKTDEDEETKVVEEKTELPSAEEKTEVAANIITTTTTEDSKPAEEIKAAEPAATEEIEKEAVTETKEMEVEETKEAEVEKEKVETEPAVVADAPADEAKVVEAEAGEPAEEKATE